MFGLVIVFLVNEYIIGGILTAILIEIPMKMYQFAWIAIFSLNVSVFWDDDNQDVRHKKVRSTQSVKSEQIVIPVNCFV